ncbi:TerB family tellurite resistance protein [Tabrizicola sp. J26]|uniref:tellurite resistance TerB family protein n=1 Tax=Alitabrizicola rongguiensis TaxID=2909234 RepID=UPI001F30B3F8|nr:TerB family tellurite resistance protein [Tabrizicola rongguiensis]MCF1709056.1 TerB family tellurite resistance protein [Tabrizicola rongguiensis]
MFDAFLRLLMAPAPARHDPEAKLALAALMVRVAKADGTYDQEERDQIDRVLAAQFGLVPAAAAMLRSDAEALEAEAPDTVRFTRVLKESFPLEARAKLMEALWEIVLSDGARDDDEESLMRLVASLLGLTDVDSALARQRAEKE